MSPHAISVPIQWVNDGMVYASCNPYANYLMQVTCQVGTPHWAAIRMDGALGREVYQPSGNIKEPPKPLNYNDNQLNTQTGGSGWICLAEKVG